MEALFFWLFSLGMIVSGLAVILNRNPVASALSFVGTIVFMAALFFMLSAFFLGWVEILVTAGAVMVLFLFIIMLLDITAAEHASRQKTWMGFTLVLALGFLFLVARVLSATPQGTQTMDSLSPPSSATVSTAQAHSQGIDDKDDTHQIATLLFTRYVAPFEVTSLLILIATIGVIVLCKQEEPSRPTRREEIIREAPPVEPKKETVLNR